MESKQTAIFKFNSGLGALLCSKCGVIIKIGQEFSPDELMAIKGEKELVAQYCNNCKK
jgi:hypothetical protein